ncbi:alpha/beta fold hydrolase [Chitinophaga tropicalis]|uniref:Alpha/beta fold hydrolase n=1 Tax=Chitinophaga tropicalis TaxID=2683588 RepID=A0A7K1UCL2_9BACT|nr:alpha/beta hydrolase [Chitinophaga tropicalis]MVT12119.1 alpha/beta fold hydrolase [Chitinophaga tropicalis]
MKTLAVHYRTIQVNDLKLFYREAGPVDAPVILLLHGYPTSSFMFRNLIPLLSRTYRVIAPDLPGFGYSDAPSFKDFSYTFDNLAKYISDFTLQLQLDKFAIYVFDYGAPVGYRLAMQHPEKISAIISQNGNTYAEGLSDSWNPLRQYWEAPTEENRESLRAFTELKLTRWQYEEGVPDLSLIAPETYTLDQHFLDRPGNVDIQLDLMKDYANNVALYPTIQHYFRTYKPKLLAVWGNKDPFFLPPGAIAYQQDLADATVKFYDTGHFALETHFSEIADDILNFLAS